MDKRIRKNRATAQRIRAALLTILAISSLACISNNKKGKGQEEVGSLDIQRSQAYDTAYFASGCFWCVEAIFESVKGVKEVISGYAGGVETDPTYEKVSYGQTTHAEAVQVIYDPKTVSFETLVTVFFGSHDPTTPNRQGPDKGSQYRSIAFYGNGTEMKTINAYIAKLEKDKVYPAPIITEVRPYINFYVAEDYHQDFERNHPNNPYIQNVSVPRLNRFKEKFPELLKKQGH